MASPNTLKLRRRQEQLRQQLTREVHSPVQRRISYARDGRAYTRLATGAIVRWPQHDQANPLVRTLRTWRDRVITARRKAA